MFPSVLKRDMLMFREYFSLGNRFVWKKFCGWMDDIKVFLPFLARIRVGTFLSLINMLHFRDKILSARRKKVPTQLRAKKGANSAAS